MTDTQAPAVTAEAPTAPQGQALCTILAQLGNGTVQLLVDADTYDLLRSVGARCARHHLDVTWTGLSTVADGCLRQTGIGDRWLITFATLEELLDLARAIEELAIAADHDVEIIDLVLAGELRDLAAAA